MVEWLGRKPCWVGEREVKLFMDALFQNFNSRTEERNGAIAGA